MGALAEATVSRFTRDTIARSREKEMAFLDGIQQRNDSFILAHFLISSVNEQFDQAGL